MTTLNLAAIDHILSAVATQEGVQPVALASTDKFAAAMERASSTNEIPSAETVNATSVAAEADQRTLRSLELPGTEAGATSGDMILEGLTKLRGVFDKEIGEVGRLLGSPSVDMKTMMAVQVEVVNFSLLVDVTSKLTGKTTQSFDTLMKGQ